MSSNSNIYIPSTFESQLSVAERIRIHTEVKRLSKPSLFISLSLILFDWTIIITCIWLVVLYKSIFAYLLTIAVIGSRQHALLLLMHDAAHWRLSKIRSVNEFLSDFFCAFPIFLTTANYRSSHLKHHKYLNTEHDPDWVLKQGLAEWTFPKSKITILKILFSRLFALQTLEMIKKIFRFGVQNKSVNKKIKIPKTFLMFRSTYYIALIIVLSVFHLWWVYLLFWIVPAFTYLPFLLRLRSLAEHFGLSWQHELNSARNVIPNVLERFFLVPHNGSYHLDHHLYPSVCVYHLNKLHKVLLQNDFYASNAVNDTQYLSFGAKSVLQALHTQNNRSALSKSRKIIQ